MEYGARGGHGDRRGEVERGGWVGGWGVEAGGVR